MSGRIVRGRWPDPAPPIEDADYFGPPLEPIAALAPTDRGNTSRASLMGGTASQHVSQADVLADFASECSLFTNERDADEIFADVAIDGHRETLRVESKQFRGWLQAKYFAATGKAAKAESIAHAIDTILAQAKYGAERVFRRIFLRSARVGDRIYLDLCNERWEVIEIDADGWRIATDPPVRFRRSTSMLPIPMPTIGGNVEFLRAFLNVKTDADFVLTVAWLLHALAGVPPFPLLPLGGEQGTGKSTYAEILRSLVDPNALPLRSLPQKEDDLFVSAARSRVLAFDNLSSIPGWLSDALCRLADGSGLSKRTLYTDEDETVITAACPLVLTSIGEVVSRPDLADRGVFVTLELIPPELRRTKKELTAQFERARPIILGALLTALSHGLRTAPDIRLERMPRMADFALWASACEGAFWAPGTFMGAYTANRTEAVEAVLEGDQVACVLRSWLARPTVGGSWEGTCTELLLILDAAQGCEGNQQRAKDWPSTASSLSNRLRKIAPGLRMVGIETTLTRTADRRCVRFGAPATSPDVVSSPSSSSPRIAAPEWNDACDGNDSYSDSADIALRDAPFDSGEGDPTEIALVRASR